MIPVLKKILFATDLSDVARNAFGFAVALADKLGSELQIVHVIKKEAPYSNEVIKMSLGEDLYKEMERKKSQAARDVLIGKKTEAYTIGEKIHKLFSEAEKKLNSSKPLQVKDFVIESGSVSEEILKIAENCDMIVMAHGHKKFLTDAMGEGTLKKVLRSATKPVILVPSPKTGSASR